MKMELTTVEGMLIDSLLLNLSLSESSDDVTGISTARYAMNYVITPILCILGIVGNVLNIIVLRRCGFKDTNVLFLESLSLADLILSVVHSVLHVHFIIEKVDVPASSLIGTFCYIYLFGPYQTVMCVVQLHLMTIAIERVIAVCFPFHAGRIFTRSRVLMCIVFLYALGIILYAPLSFVFQVGWTNPPGTNQTVAILVPREDFLVNESLNKYLVWGLGKITDSILPGATVLCCIIVGIKLLRRKKQFLQKMSKKKDGNDLKGLRLLMAVCAVSVLFAVPAVVINYYFSVYHIYSGPFHELLVDIANTICQLFSSTNFIIYVTMSKKFFRTYRKMVCNCL